MLLVTAVRCQICVSCYQTDQILQLSAFVDAEVDYHRQSVDVLERLLECLRERSDHITFILLADRTNGRAIATLLRLSSSSVVCLSVTLCIVAKRCVLEQKLLWRAYRKSYMRNRLVPK